VIEKDLAARWKLPVDVRRWRRFGHGSLGVG